MTQAKKTIILAAAATIQFGCADREPTGLQQLDSEVRTSTLNQSGRNTIDAQFEQLASEIPGFGGLFFDRSGRLNVFLTVPSSRDIAIPTLDAFFANRVLSIRGKPIDVAGMVVHQGQFDFRHLAAWRRMLNREVFSLPGVYSTDIDESRNRVVLGVSDLALTSAIMAIIHGKGIPSAAIIVELGSRVQGVQKGGSIDEGTLADTIRPTVGGLLIGYSDVSRGACTLGFNASGEKFVTNSHCSRDHGGVFEPSTFWQPYGGLLIGAETFDPIYQNITAYDSRCPPDKLCRYSDALYGTYDSGVAADVGYIARTTEPGIDNGSIVIDTFNPRWTLLSSVGWGYVGEDLQKVGAETGWTYGLVTHSCIDVPYTTPAGDATDKFHICQMRFQGGVGGGDSGSPVFKIEGNTAVLYGIIWGKDQFDRGFFSPLMQIQEELGSLDYWP